MQLCLEKLSDNGFTRRYITDERIEGVPGTEATFLPCSFWMVDALLMLGERREAERRFEQLLNIQSDLGLYAEEYDPHALRMLGNFPQAFTHVAFIHSALTLDSPAGEEALCLEPTERL